VIATVENLDAKKARSISARVDEVAEEMAAERKREAHRLLQACVFECVALAKHWRAAVEYFTDSISREPRDFDYRNLRDILLPAAQRTKTVYREIHEMIIRSAGAIQDGSELVMAATENEKIIRWLETWPTNDPAHRNAARESYARGEIVSDAELATW
jgi:hypothetical protein